LREAGEGRKYLTQKKGEGSIRGGGPSGGERRKCRHRGQGTVAVKQTLAEGTTGNSKKVPHQRKIYTNDEDKPTSSIGVSAFSC